MLEAAGAGAVVVLHRAHEYRRVTFTGAADELRGRVAELGARGVTGIAYQPSGPDAPRKLTAFARMAGLG